MQTIFKMANRDKPFARIPHDLLCDERISWQAKGILCYLLSKPDGWKVRVSDLIKQGTAGKDAVRAALRELRANGYAELKCHRDGNGKVLEWVWKVSDSPMFRPDSDFPEVDNPELESRQHSKRDGSKNESTKNESKESKETSSSMTRGSELEFDPTWKPSALTKEQQLRRIRPPTDYPEQSEFDDFLEAEDLSQIINYRPELYVELCKLKWHQWSKGGNKWIPVRDWRAYVVGLNDTMER